MWVFRLAGIFQRKWGSPGHVCYPVHPRMVRAPQKGHCSRQWPERRAAPWRNSVERCRSYWGLTACPASKRITSARRSLQADTNCCGARKSSAVCLSLSDGELRLANPASFPPFFTIADRTSAVNGKATSRRLSQNPPPVRMGQAPTRKTKGLPNNSMRL